jgi:hypothetical protein
MGLEPSAGVYLTDEVGLFRVVGANKGEMLLEDAREPELPLITVTAKELREQKWRSITPAKEKAA